MRFVLPLSALALVVALLPPRTELAGQRGGADTIHEIRLERTDRGFRYAPRAVRARPGDVLLFRVAGNAPHGVAFERAGLSAEVRRAWNAVMPRRTADLTGPVLTGPGVEYRVRVPAVPPGSYRFYCLPHRAYNMEGTVEVIAP